MRQGLAQGLVNLGLAVVDPMISRNPSSPAARKLVAMVLREPGREALVDKLASGPAGARAPTMAEAGRVRTAKLGPRGRSLHARVVQEARIAVAPLTDEHWPIAVDAYARFGNPAPTNRTAP